MIKIICVLDEYGVAILNEEWRPVKDLNYEVSSYGRVRNKNTHKILLSFDMNRTGYIRVNLYNKGKKKRYFIHRLVAEAFLPKIQGKDFVNHKDGNKRNNELGNLEWCNASENMKHSYHILKNKTGFAYGFGGSDEPWNKGRTDLKETRPEIYKKGWETRKQKKEFKNV